MASGERSFGTGTGACRVVRSGEAYQGKQGLTYLRGLTSETAGSKAICMTVLVLPDGARAKNRGVETAVYIIEGRSEVFFGPRLEDRVNCAAGDYVYSRPTSGIS